MHFMQKDGTEDGTRENKQGYRFARSLVWLECEVGVRR